MKKEPPKMIYQPGTDPETVKITTVVVRDLPPGGKQEPQKITLASGSVSWPMSLSIMTCTRCGHQWIKRLLTKPKRCPCCKTPYWNRPRGPKWAAKHAAAKEGKA
jgi:ribosomal protein L37E